MKLLIFEFAMAMGLEDPSLTLEGRAMIEGLIKDLDGLDDMDVHYLVSENVEINLTPLNTESNSRNGCAPLEIKEDLFSWLDKHVKNYDACLPLAPEEHFILHDLTQKIETNQVKVIGSASDAVLICSNKLLTYNLLKDRFPFIETQKIFFSDLKQYKTFFNEERKMVVKPADGVSCQGVEIVQSYRDFIKASARAKRLTQLPYFLLQDFADGISASVSVLSNGKTALPLSLNLQNVDVDSGEISYNGGMVPFEHELSAEAKVIAKNAVESIEGLKGYVGVDVILGENEDEDRVKIIEINPRLTTPYVVLREIINFNLTGAIIASADGALPSEVVLNGSLTFNKEENYLNIAD